MKVLKYQYKYLAYVIKVLKYITSTFKGSTKVLCPISLVKLLRAHFAVL